MHKSRISRTLLAGTVLTAAPITALHAGTITESADFSENQSQPFNLPVGTTVVNGTIGGSDYADYFLFQGLGAGTFTLSFTSDTLDCGGAGAFTSSGTPLGFFGICGESVLSPEVVATGVVPGDGKLLVRFNNETGTAAYSVSLDAPLAETVPEPSTFAAGLLAGGAMLWRRRRAKSN